MPAPTLTRTQFLALDSCPGARRRINDALGGEDGWASPVTAAQARAAGATLGDLIWVAEKIAMTDTDVERRLRLWLADCAAHVLHIYERIGKSKAPRDAIVAARQSARGDIGADDLTAARAAAWAAVRDAGNAAMDAAWEAARAAAWAAVWVAVRDVVRAAARAAARVAAWDAARDAAWFAVRDVAWDAEEAWQFDRLVLWLSDEEPEDWPLSPRKG